MHPAFFKNSVLQASLVQALIELEHLVSLTVVQFYMPIIRRINYALVFSSFFEIAERSNSHNYFDTFPA